MRVDLDHFEQTYQNNIDPWNFTESPYELRRFDITMASLPRLRYRRCFEPGCSIGSLTKRLADRCQEVVATEASATASAEAARRLRNVDNVAVSTGSIPEQWPTGQFDLVMWSELGYYWDSAELAAIVEQARSLLVADGHIVGVHWLGSSDDHLLSGHEVQAVMMSLFGERVVHQVDTDFLLDIWPAK